MNLVTVTVQEEGELGSLSAEMRTDKDVNPLDLIESMQLNTGSIIQYLKDQHPYPKDTFKPVKAKEWADIIKMLQDNGYDDVRILMNMARVGYESAISKLEDIK